MQQFFEGIVIGAIVGIICSLTNVPLILTVVLAFCFSYLWGVLLKVLRATK